MPEERGPGREEDKKRRFITEKVVRQPLTRRQILKLMFALCCAAVLFGIIAAVSFTLSQPIAARFLGEEPSQESTISIPKDEPSDTTAFVETEPEPETESEAPSEPVEEQIRSIMEKYRFTVDDLNDLFASLRQQVQAADKGIVVIHSIRQDTDWFDNPVETFGQYAGAVIARTDMELLILTPEAAIENADSIVVTFSDGKEAGGRIKQRDTIAEMAVVSVNVADMEESTLKDVAVLALGNSYMVREGDLLVAVGCPMGVAHSVDYGFVSYIMKSVRMVDQMGRVIYSGVRADSEKGTFLLNTSGELIGWRMKPGENEDAQIARIMGISDYKSILEKLTNGLGAPCFGIEGQEVTEEMVSRGLPKGIYVMNCMADRPAYNAGIQNGDIITKINDREVTTMKEFQGLVDNMECGQLLHVIVQRNGREQYTELEFQVTVGAR